MANHEKKRTPAADADDVRRLVDRATDSVYDFCLRVSGDSRVARALTGQALSQALRDIPVRDLDDRSFLAYVLTVARKVALERVRPGRYARPTAGEGIGGAEAFAALDDKALDEDGATGDAQRMAEYVWRSATTLNPREYATLDLHLRRGLTAIEQAHALGVSAGAARAMAAEVRRPFEEKVISEIMLAEGRTACAELDSLLRKDAIRTPSARAAALIDRHSSECASCRSRRDALPPPANVFAALRIIEAPAALREEIWHAGLSGERKEPRARAVTPVSRMPSGHREGRRSSAEESKPNGDRRALPPVLRLHTRYRALLLGALLLLVAGGISGGIFLALRRSGGVSTGSGPAASAAAEGAASSPAGGGVAPAASETVSPACSGVHTGCAVTVVNLAPDQLNVRDAAGTQAQILGKLADGEQACVLAGPTSADGYSWFQIRSAGGLAGWAAIGDPADPAKPWLTAAGSACSG